MVANRKLDLLENPVASRPNVEEKKRRMEGHPLVNACTNDTLEEVRALIETYPSVKDVVNVECDQLVKTTSPPPPLIMQLTAVSIILLLFAFFIKKMRTSSSDLACTAAMPATLGIAPVTH